MSADAKGGNGREDAAGADPFDLGRFTAAQDERGTYRTALSELRSGRKQTHWIWFVFPQVAGLGHSSTSRHFAISGMPEARAYLAHPVLGPRLEEASRVAADVPDKSAEEVFGSTDAQKLRSSMTLFLRADPAGHVFQEVLDRYYGGVPDARTDELLTGRNTAD